MEKLLWLIECVKSGLQSFVLEISRWTMLQGRVGKLRVDSDQMETLIESNQCSTMWEIDDILKIPKSVKLLVNMKNVFYFMEKP